jgi:hypothetical protein
VETGLRSLPRGGLVSPTVQDSLDSLFHSLCFDRPGAVAIRSSYRVYKQFRETDFKGLLRKQPPGDSGEVGIEDVQLLDYTLRPIPIIHLEPSPVPDMAPALPIGLIPPSFTKQTIYRAQPLLKELLYLILSVTLGIIDRLFLWWNISHVRCVVSILHGA